MPRKPAATTLQSNATLAPQSWRMSDWDVRAASVYPNSTQKAKYLFRMHKRELLEAGAVARVGRDIIFIGDKYTRWLARQASRVADFDCSANKDRAAQQA